MLRQNKVIVFSLLAPALLLVALTTTYPLLAALFFSFHKFTLRDAPEWALRFGGDGEPFLMFDPSLLTFENYIEAFDDRRFINSLEVTFWFTVVSVVLSVVIGLAIALLVQKEGRLHTATKIILIFPFAVSPALKGFSWRFMLNENYGIYDQLIDNHIIPLIPAFNWIIRPIMNLLVFVTNLLGDLIALIGAPGWEFDYLALLTTETVWLGDQFWALVMLAMSEVWGWAPLIALMFVGALGSIDNQIFEAARIDGASNVSIFFRVTLPLLRPVILIVTMLKTIFSLKMFDQVVTMTGGGPVRATQTINFYIHNVGFVRSLDIGYASAMAYLLVIVLTICAVFYTSLVLNR
jgi:multiple sugar transport system permease protein